MASDNHPQLSSTPIILAQLKDIASAVMYAAEAGTVEQVLERIAHVSKELVNARYAALGVPDGKGGLRFFKVAGMSSEAIALLDHLPVGHGLLGSIMKERKSIRLERMADDERSAGFCRAHPVMTSLLGVPVQVGNQLFGTLYLCDREDGQPFSEQDEWLIETMAGYAALAIAGSEMGDKQHRLMLLEERERIAMELHDGIIQSLYAIGMHLDLMRLSGKADEEQTGEVLHNIDGVIEDIRRFIMNLQRKESDQKTVAQYLQDVVNRLHPPSTIKIEVVGPNNPPLFTPATFEAILQMANEAISNAIRHAEATVIQVLAKRQNGKLHITVADNGKGFNPEELASNRGLGLRNIQQRAAMYNGLVEIESTPNQGTRLSIIVPLQMRE
jgi:signal transduction histidine kinase